MANYHAEIASFDFQHMSGCGENITGTGIAEEGINKKPPVSRLFLVSLDPTYGQNISSIHDDHID